MTGALRRLAERASRNARFRARLPERFGRRPIWLSPANQLAVLKPGDAKFQSYLLGFAERFIEPGDAVWDIGANMGMFAVPAAHRAKQVHAFEPDPFNVDLLHRTMRDNSDLALDVLPVAMSNRVGVARLAIPERGRSANNIVGFDQGTQMGGVRQEFSVMTITCDWALDQFGPPDFIKIDAEGAELAILEGATRLLSEARPVIVIEMANANAAGSAAILRRHDYVMLSAYAAVDPAKAVDDLRDVWDVLAVPREKLDRLAGR